jgi:hypothetical protein
VFDIAREFRFPTRVAINDENCKKPHINSLLLVEVEVEIEIDLLNTWTNYSTIILSVQPTILYSYD